MARDYAQGQRGKRKPRARKHAATPATPGWVWLLLGIAIGAVAAAAFWIMRPAEPGMQRVVTAPPATRAEQQTEEGIQLPPEKPSRFSFYELLPSYEVVIPRDEPRPRQRPEAAPPPDSPTLRDTPPADRPSSLPDEGQYLIQVSSFRGRSDAEAQRAQLALIGLEARIETVTIDNTQTWYRVRVGPFGNAAAAHSAMMRLQEHGLNDVMLMRVRG